MVSEVLMQTDPKGMAIFYDAMMESLDSIIDGMAQEWRASGFSEWLISRCVADYWAEVRQNIAREYNAAPE